MNHVPRCREVDTARGKGSRYSAARAGMLCVPESWHCCMTRIPVGFARQGLPQWHAVPWDGCFVAACAHLRRSGPIGTALCHARCAWPLAFCIVPALQVGAVRCFLSYGQGQSPVVWQVDARHAFSLPAWVRPGHGFGRYGQD